MYYKSGTASSAKIGAEDGAWRLKLQMNDLVSYLLAQARYRPVATAKFAAGEIWRRGRLRLLDSLESDLPAFST